MRLVARLVSASELTPPQRDAMFLLMDRHYANVHPKVFERDLAEKQWVILVSDPVTEQLCGFSTQRLLVIEVEGRPVTVLFSGDTIIDREHWGDRALSRAWGRHALSLIDAHPEAELYWFLIAQGFRTYRFLPLFFHEYYPRHDAATPARARAVLDAAAVATDAEHHEAASGVIRASAWQYHLRAGLAEVSPQRMQDPAIRFFHDRNPGHPNGDELCCLAPLTRANFTTAAYRVIGLPSGEPPRR
jgi:hypothetical protein